MNDLFPTSGMQEQIQWLKSQILCLKANCCDDGNVGGSGINLYNTSAALDDNRVVTMDDKNMTFLSTSGTFLSKVTNNVYNNYFSVGVTETSLQYFDGTIKGSVVANASGLNLSHIDGGGTTAASFMATGLDLTFGASKDLRINSSPGIASQVLLSQGPNLPPIWGNVPAVLANNGLTKNVNTIQLGGTLIQPTLVEMGNFPMTWSAIGTGVFGISTDNGSSLHQISVGDLSTTLVTLDKTDTNNQARIQMLIPVPGVTAPSLLNRVNYNGSTAEIGVGGTGITMVFGASRDLRINSDAGITGQVLTSQGIGVAPIWTTLPPSSTDNIYTIDGALAGPRTVTTGTNNLSFVGTGGEYLMSLASGGVDSEIQLTTTSGFMGHTGILGNVSAVSVANNSARLYVDNGLEVNGITFDNNGANLQLGLTDDLRINSDSGTAGEVLTSSGPGLPPSWTNVAALGGSNNIIFTSVAGNYSITDGAGTLTTPIIHWASTDLDITTARNHDVLANLTYAFADAQFNLTFSGTADLRLNGSAGTTNQVLSSNGPGLAPSWKTVAVGSTDNIYNINGSLTANRTVTTTTRNLFFLGTGGQYLMQINNGSAINQMQITPTLTSIFHTNFVSGNASAFLVQNSSAQMYAENGLETNGITFNTNGVNIDVGALNSLRINNNGGTLNQVLSSNGPTAPPTWKNVGTLVSDTNYYNTNLTSAGGTRAHALTSLQLSETYSDPALNEMVISKSSSNFRATASSTVNGNSSFWVRNDNIQIKQQDGAASSQIEVTNLGVNLTLVGRPLFLAGLPGVAGQVLTSNGPSLPPTWTIPSGFTDTNLFNTNLTQTVARTHTRGGTLTTIGYNSGTATPQIGTDSYNAATVEYTRRIDSTFGGDNVGRLRIRNSDVILSHTSISALGTVRLASIELSDGKIQLDTILGMEVNGNTGLTGEVLTSTGPLTPPVWLAVPGNSDTNIYSNNSQFTGFYTSDLNDFSLTFNNSLTSPNGPLVAISNNGLSSTVVNSTTPTQSSSFGQTGSLFCYMKAGDTVAGTESQIRTRHGWIDLLLTGGADLRVNNSAGTLDAVLTSEGTGVAPTWKTQLDYFVIATGGETTVTVPEASLPVSTAYILVTRNGIIIRPDATNGYTHVAATGVITLNGASQPLVAGDEIYIQYK